MTGVIVHEWLERYGGAENVVERLTALYPDAAVHALWNDAPERFPGVGETWLARTPLRRRKALALPLEPATWRHLGRSEAEWILCSSHLFAHHARFSGPARQAPKFVYVHTPARYVWSPELDERGRSLPVRLASPPLRAIDRRRAAEAHSVVGNSAAVRDRIRRHWGVDAGVIHPPVDVDAFTGEYELSEQDAAVLAALPSEFLLGASRFVSYKRLDLVIRAGLAAGLPVVLAGDGPEREALGRLAAELGVETHFVPRPSHPLLVALFRRSAAFVFPAVEDFGIMPVEAMATGTPVIARDVGGTAETVLDGVSGALLSEFDADAVREAVQRVRELDPRAVVARAREFDATVFDRRIREWLPS
ncbi:glycosyltransferase family 4 protein [Microbacterium bovistercoris]|uniref:D-inositol 3-phosphate glycosyltransferase n=1 Tax=Microbacterium bovistercoris TaxID=2293570 RepID=A0A371NXJ1_9MICO|nr:glycosyltransferase [Microbacterium bovistercoris]REJ08016.1 glycosyltransferase family 4 protein [Microbacterium bovistercoris]